MILRFLCSLLFITSFSMALPMGSLANSMIWQFDVYLDEKPIGTHRFVVQRAGADALTVISEAEYQVKILLLTLYRYQHQSKELWQQGCLQQMNASTNDNGKQLTVYGERTEDGFNVRTRADENQSQSEPSLACARSFAYWHPELLLQSDALINPQTGELLAVNIEAAGNEPLVIGEQIIVSQRYQLTAEELKIALWYSPDNRWLALQSEMENGRVLRYQATEIPERIGF